MTTDTKEPWYEPIWHALQVWGVPFGMGIAYTMLIWSADTDNTGRAWLSVGFAFVLVIWYVFRLLANEAALARAIDVGDTDRIFDVTERNLRRTKAPAARAPFLVARAFGHQLRAEWPAALASLDEADVSALPDAKRALWAPRATAIRIAALVGSGKTTEARTVLERDLPPSAKHPVHSLPYLLTNLAAGRVLAAEGKRDEARTCFARVTDDIRASASMRAAVDAALAT